MDAEFMALIGLDLAALTWLIIKIAKERLGLPGSYVPLILPVLAAVTAGIVYWITKDKVLAMGLAGYVTSAATIHGGEKVVKAKVEGN